MALNIDIAFRWLQKKKKDEEEKKKKQGDQESQASGTTTGDETTGTDSTDDESTSSTSSSSESLNTGDGSEDDEKLKTLIADSARKRSEKKDTQVEMNEKEVKERQPGVPVFRRIIFVRHGERMDRVFPSWQHLANSNEEYKRYDTNQPLIVVDRRCGIAGFSNDSPITSMGRIEAQLVGQSLKHQGGEIAAIYSSPALRCLQTAAVIYSELLRHNKDNKTTPKILVEPALFDFLGWYFDGIPLWLTNKEMLDAGFPIDPKYKPVVTREKMLRNRAESKHDYYRRSDEAMRKILGKVEGTILVVGHATTIDSTVRGVLRLPVSVPTSRQMDTLSVKYPYCCSCVLEQYQDFSGKGQWRIGDNLMPITSLGQSSRLDFKFLLRK